VTTVAEQKNALRARMRTLAGAADPASLAADSRRAVSALLAHEAFSRASALMLYIATRGEPDLAPLIPAALARAKTVALPRMDWDAHTMTPVAIDRPDFPTEVRRHGIAEPAAGPEVPLAELDLVLVPGLAFDSLGFRLGRGAGFYDRFLADLRRARPAGRTDALVVGVCSDAQIVPEVPHDAHDQPVDALLTQSGVRQCRASG